MSHATEQHWAFTRWVYNGAQQTDDLLRDEWQFGAGVSSGRDTGSKLGLGARRTEGLLGVGGRVNIRMDLGTEELLTADGTGQGITIGAARQVKEGFFCRNATAPLPAPAHLPTLFPGNPRKQGNSSKPSHREESLAHAEGLE